MSMPDATLCLVLHNHQPIGNFDDCIEQAYRDSYLPFLDVFEDEAYQPLKITLHTSGPLLLWLEQHHPEYIDRVKDLVAAGRIEILGGPFYEAILPMLPSRDRTGQIRRYIEFLEMRFQTQVRGMWVPERVWEPGLVGDLVRAGIDFTLLDDYHFKAAGWNDTSLTGGFVTEDNGALLQVFPGSERLRYLIPFAHPDETIRYAAEVARHSPGAVLVFGDDGEKFGTWPGTKKHVYEDGWLRKFFDALMENRQWLHTERLGDVATREPAAGKIYLPDCSYREMTQWSLPVDRQQRYQELAEDLDGSPYWQELAGYLRGGTWRNFLVRYRESNEMYSRMLQVSRRLEAARRSGHDGELIAEVEDHLYRSQCNCAYWHGAFGGIYLPHLRNAVYRNLIVADNLLDHLDRGAGPWVDARTDDFNLDGRTEVQLASDQFIALLAPSEGGMLYELDVRATAQNVLATMQRRPEAYHSQVRIADESNEAGATSIHSVVRCKQNGLADRLHYDRFPRKSFLEHFFDADVSASDVAEGRAMERGDFVAQPFQARLRRSATKVQLQLTRQGNAWGVPLTLTKAMTLTAGSPVIEAAYLIEGLPQDREFHLALEWNFAGMPGNAEGRYFYDCSGEPLGDLSQRLALEKVQEFGLIDQWEGLDVLITLSQPAGLWTHPVETVNQSEAGIELVHQSVCVMPHWIVRGDVSGRWAVRMQLTVAPGRKPRVLNQPQETAVAEPANMLNV